MDILSWFMVFLYRFFAVGYAQKNYKLIAKYQDAVENDELQICNGEVVSKVDERRRNVKSDKYSICYPVFKYMIDEKELYYQGVIEYANVNVGQSVTLHYNKNTGDVWVGGDISLIKKRVLIWFVKMGLLLLLLMTTNIVHQ